MSTFSLSDDDQYVSRVEQFAIMCIARPAIAVLLILTDEDVMMQVKSLKEYPTALYALGTTPSAPPALKEMVRKVMSADGGTSTIKIE